MLVSALPPALQLTHYDADADAPTHGPPSPAHSGSGVHGPPGSENGDSPVLSRKPIGTARSDDRHSIEARSVQKRGSDSDDHDHRHPGDSPVSPYPRRSFYDPEPDYSDSRPGRKPNAGGWFLIGRHFSFLGILRLALSLLTLFLVASLYSSTL